MNWMERAACAGQPPEWWFPEKRSVVTDEARRICMGCQVRVECQLYAMKEDIRDGMWGGLTAHERARARRNRKEVTL